MKIIHKILSKIGLITKKRAKNIALSMALFTAKSIVMYAEQLKSDLKINKNIKWEKEETEQNKETWIKLEKGFNCNIIMRNTEYGYVIDTDDFYH